MNDRFKPVHLLLAEDDEVDIKAFRRAKDKLKIPNPLTIARDGAEAWSMLKGENGHAPFPRPNIVILDLNMPRVSGLDLLRRIRADQQLRDTVVFILTSSSDEQDIIDAYNLNVTGYMQKYDLTESFTEAVRLINSFWRIVSLPAEPTTGHDDRAAGAAAGG